MVKSSSTIFACLLILVVSCSYLSDDVKIIFQNASSNTLAAVRICYAGGEYVATNIPPNGVFRARIRPVAESGLTVDVNCDAEQISMDLNQYIEPGYRGKVTILFTPDKHIRAKCDIIPL